MPITSPRASGRSYPVPPVSWENTEEWIRQIAESVRNIMDGKINATGTVTLAANQATTTLNDVRIGRDTQVKLTATTANGATAIATTYQTYPNANKQLAVINHANNAQVDRTFGYVLLG